MQAEAHSGAPFAANTGLMARLLLPLWIVAVLAALGVRLWAGQGLPLWIDETWTAMIAGQPDWTSFWREAWRDVNPPLYYLLMRGWTALAGNSDLALRVPSMAFVLAAAALPLFLKANGLSRSAALCLSALILLWRPGFEISLDARGYGLLLFVSTAQMFAFARLLNTPNLRTAAIWALCAAAAILTHYFALVPAAVQGAMLLWQERARAFRLWPAALPFVPAFGWLACHAPRLADYARPDVAWYEPVTPQLAGGFIQYVVGPPGWLLWGQIAATIVMTVTFSKGQRRDVGPAAHALEKSALCGAVSLLLLLGIGLVRASLTDRYLVPVVPSLLLGLVMLVQRFRKGELGLALLILTFLVPMASASDLRRWLEERTFYGFERASQYLLPHRPERLTFVWDHPAARILDPQSLTGLGRFFFDRAGQPVTAQATVLKPGEDGNHVLQNRSHGGAVIWIYNRARASAARSHPPVASRWVGWTCQHERGPWVGILTCVQVAKPVTPVKVTP